MQSVDETAVGKTVQACGSIDADNPQLAEITLLLLAADICILAGCSYSLHCYAIDAGTCTIVALGRLKDLVMAGMSNHTTFNSRHFLLLRQLKIRQHAENTMKICLVDSSHRAKMTLTLGSLLGQDVRLVAALTLKAVGGLLEPLPGTLVVLDLRHFITLTSH